MNLLFNDLSDKEKSELFDELFSKYLSHGFQSLSKRDLDLLLFNICTRKAFSERLSISEIARTLRINTPKVKTLRIDSELRWSSIDNKQVIENVIKRTISDKNLKYLESNHKDSLNKGKIPIVVEDPIEKFSVEEVIKSDGGIVDYRFNRDVIEIDTEALLRMGTIYYSQEQEFDSKLKERLEKEKKLKELLTTDIRNLSSNDLRKLVNELGFSLISDFSKNSLKALCRVIFPFI